MVSPRVRPRKPKVEPKGEDPFAEVKKVAEVIPDDQAQAELPPPVEVPSPVEDAPPAAGVDKPKLTPKVVSQGAKKEAPTPVTGIVKLEILKLEDHTEYLKILIYGPAGVGKTVLAASVDEVVPLSPALLVDMEAGTMSVQNRKGLRFVKVSTWKDVVALMTMLKSKELQDEYKTIIIDSISEMQRIIMAGVMAQAVAQDPSHDKEVPYRQDWGRASERTRRIIKQLRNLPYNIIMTALSKESQDEAGVVSTLPAMPGQLAGETAAFMDIVGFLQTAVARAGRRRSIVRRLFIQPTGRFIAKDRSDHLGSMVENPTMQIIHDLIGGSRKAAEIEDEEEEPTETPDQPAEAPVEEPAGELAEE